MLLVDVNNVFVVVICLHNVCPPELFKVSSYKFFAKTFSPSPFDIPDLETNGIHTVASQLGRLRLIVLHFVTLEWNVSS